MDVAAAGKTLEAEIQESKPLAIISNGVLKRHHHTAFNNYQDGGFCTGGGVVVYKECLKNHAASLGAHAVDGCGEFMPSPASNPADPTSLKCAACGCHRNFHRQESDDALTSTVPSSNSTLAIEYQPHHRHHPPPPPPPPPPPAGSHSSPSSESPPPISSSYYPSAPHLLLTLSGGIAAAAATHQDHLTPPGGRSAPVISHSNGRKRFRTRFTQDQKGKMLEFAEKLEWKMQKKDEGLITGFCNEIGVEKGVFKVWMHNNKNYPSGGSGSGGKSSSIPIPSTINTNSCSATTNNGNNNGIEIAQQNHDKEINDHFQEQNRHQHDDSFSGRVVGPYGSSTSS